ncbi:MAG: hypothetical protein HPY50_11100 [Firmicutes bacterium]|nr:hypothetical protein [Bacillota bacterium]
MIIRTGYKNIIREIDIEVGQVYYIEPLNPLKTKNQGRGVVVLAFLEQNQRALVKYLDNNRSGKVHLSDLNSRNK